MVKFDFFRKNMARLPFLTEEFVLKEYMKLKKFMKMGLKIFLHFFSCFEDIFFFSEKFRISMWNCRFRYIKVLITKKYS